jgi:hypothetical protein
MTTINSGNKAPHIIEMRRAFSNMKAMVDINGITMVNFAKWTEFHRCIKEVLCHKPLDISNYCQTKAGALAYLKSQLQDISPDFTVGQDLETRSCKLQQEEDLVIKGKKSHKHLQGESKKAKRLKDLLDF